MSTQRNPKINLSHAGEDGKTNYCFASHWGKQGQIHSGSDGSEQYHLWINMCNRLSDMQDDGYEQAVKYIKDEITKFKEGMTLFSRSMSYIKSYIKEQDKTWNIENELAIWNLRSLEILMTDYLIHQCGSNKIDAKCLAEIVVELRNATERFIKPIVNDVINPELIKCNRPIITVAEVHELADKIRENIISNYLVHSRNNLEFMQQWGSEYKNRNEYLAWIRMCNSFASNIENDSLSKLVESVDVGNIKKEIKIWNYNTILWLVLSYLADRAHAASLDIGPIAKKIAREFVMPLISKINSIADEKDKIKNNDDGQPVTITSVINDITDFYRTLYLTHAYSDDAFSDHWGKKFDSRQAHRNWLSFCNGVHHYFGCDDKQCRGLTNEFQGNETFLAEYKNLPRTDYVYPKLFIDYIVNRYITIKSTGNNNASVVIGSIPDVLQGFFRAFIGDAEINQQFFSFKTINNQDTIKLLFLKIVDDVIACDNNLKQVCDGIIDDTIRIAALVKHDTDCSMTEAKQIFYWASVRSELVARNEIRKLVVSAFTERNDYIQKEKIGVEQFFAPEGERVLWSTFRSRATVCHSGSKSALFQPLPTTSSATVSVEPPTNSSTLLCRTSKSALSM